MATGNQKQYAAEITRDIIASFHSEISEEACKNDQSIAAAISQSYNKIHETVLGCLHDAAIDSIVRSQSDQINNHH
ncbi:hypothetical protein [Paenibacillus hexagrammi]|uniref:Uncharacterized protein n=1 Tax=Paenibacillus hexagrammi TaxID=2908839 RepID=A0ABY3SP13_9BACL|nr:hypothetical protein [Paenibacillus sp. YPD9-1]UJF35699.1 hypothetical protein L0M14_11770 [Paenibacillus sp. YPD9-1]